jgi:hypothetical protein|tara:strand:+ start:21966 stop:22271 length:306 start_codon:yes stop_codon:yes gene_type:complete
VDRPPRETRRRAETVANDDDATTTRGGTTRDDRTNATTTTRRRRVETRERTRAMETMRVGRCNLVRVRETTRWRRDGTIRARPVDAIAIATTTTRRLGRRD